MLGSLGNGADLKVGTLIDGNLKKEKKGSVCSGYLASAGQPHFLKNAKPKTGVQFQDRCS